MTQRTLKLTQNNNLPKRCPSKGSFRFNQFGYKETRKANYDFGQNNTWKQILRGKLLRYKISQDETQVFRASSPQLIPREGQQTPNLNMCAFKEQTDILVKTQNEDTNLIILVSSLTAQLFGFPTQQSQNTPSTKFCNFRNTV